MPFMRSAIAAAVLAAFAAAPALGQSELETRKFTFTYETAVTDIPEGARIIDLWIPVAQTNESQTVALDMDSVPPGGAIRTEAAFGNRIFHQRFEAPFTEPIAVTLSYTIERREVEIAEAKNLPRAGEPATRRAIPPQPAMAKYLGSTAMVPLEGRLTQIAAELDLAALSPMLAGRRVYDYVLELMSYGKSKPGWGRGDALWACDARTGNCSDFHSVFNGLMRARDVPAMFEIGFALPPGAAEGEIGGYHCWAWFHVEGIGWAPVDISEADKRPEMAEYYFGAVGADRVAFSRGRDLTLVPAQQGGPVNFFIYPYIEVDGAVHAAHEKRFTFRDLK